MYFDQMVAESLGDEIAINLRNAITSVQNDPYFYREKKSKYPFNYSFIIT